MKQNGFAHILIVLLVLGGILLGTYLVQNPGKLRSLASSLVSTKTSANIKLLPVQGSPQIRVIIHYDPSENTFVGTLHGPGADPSKISIPGIDTTVHPCNGLNITWDEIDAGLRAANLPERDLVCTGARCSVGGACRCVGTGLYNYDHGPRELAAYYKTAQECRSQTCQDHLDNWTEVDAELHAAGYTGAYDHGLKETQAYERTALFCKVPGPRGQTQVIFNVCGQALPWNGANTNVVGIDDALSKAENGYVPHHDNAEIIEYEEKVCHFDNGPAGEPNAQPTTIRLSTSLSNLEQSLERAYRDNMEVDIPQPAETSLTVYVQFKVKGIWSDPLSATTELNTIFFQQAGIDNVSISTTSATPANPAPEAVNPPSFYYSGESVSNTSGEIFPTSSPQPSNTNQSGTTLTYPGSSGSFGTGSNNQGSIRSGSTNQLSGGNYSTNQPSAGSNFSNSTPGNSTQGFNQTNPTPSPILTLPPQSAPSLAPLPKPFTEVIPPPSPTNPATPVINSFGSVLQNINSVVQGLLRQFLL